MESQEKELPFALSARFRNALERLASEHMRELAEVYMQMQPKLNAKEPSVSTTLGSTATTLEFSRTSFPFVELRSVDTLPSPQKTKPARVPSLKEKSDDHTFDGVMPSEALPNAVNPDPSPEEIKSLRTSSALQSIDPRISQRQGQGLSPIHLARERTMMSTDQDSLPSSASFLFHHDGSRISSQSRISKMSTRKEVLKVSMIAANGLRKADWGIGVSSDPYCVCSIDGKPWANGQTHVCPNTLDPVWKCEHIVADYDLEDALTFTVYDEDLVGDDDPLGHAVLTFDQFYPIGFEGQLPLAEAGKGINASIHVKVEVLTMSDDCVLLKEWIQVPAELCKQVSSAKWSDTPASLTRDSRVIDPKILETARYLIRPDSIVRLIWDFLGLFVLLIDLIWIPMQAFDPPESGVLAVFAWTTLIYWSCDIVASFNTGYYGRDGKMIMQRSLITCRYLRGWFCFDFLIIGLDWGTIVQKLVSEEGSMKGQAGAARAGKLARAFRIARLLRLMRLAKLRQLLFTLQGLIDSEWLTIVFTVSKNLLTILALNHYIACGWFAVGSVDEGWVHVHGIQDKDYGYQYLLSIHWSMAQFTPGATLTPPSTQGERLYNVFVLALGLVVATCFVSSITTTLSSVWAMNRQAAMQGFLLKKFLNQNGISRGLGARVTRYVDNVIELRQKKVHPSKVQYLSMLSGPLHMELQTEIWEPRLITNPMFKQYSVLSVSAMNEICFDGASNSVYGRGDLIFKESTKSGHMYFLTSGALAYRYCYPGVNRPHVLKLNQGYWCSEGTLWMEWTHRGQMRAASYADIVVLDAKKFIEVTTSHSAVYRFARNRAFMFWHTFDRKSTVDISEEVQMQQSGGTFPKGGGVDMSVLDETDIKLIRFNTKELSKKSSSSEVDRSPRFSRLV